MTGMNLQCLRLGALVVAFASLAVAPEIASAQKKASKTHALVILDTGLGGAMAMSEVRVEAGEAVSQVVGWRDDLAWHWRVSASKQVESSPLALPADVDPLAPAAIATGVNERGWIVGGYRSIGAGPGQPLLWTSAAGSPSALPLPSGFSGWAMPRSVNDDGVIVGELSGQIVTAGVASPVEGLVVWLAWTDIQGATQIDPPTWFTIPNLSTPRINQDGWVAFASDGAAYRLLLVHHWAWDETLAREVAQFFVAAGGTLFGSDKIASVGGINAAGDVAGNVRTINQPGRDVYAQRLNGTFLSLPVYVNDRTYGTYVHGIKAINDANSAHGVQVLGRVGTYTKKGGALGAWNWALWESGGSVRLLKDVTVVPADTSYDFSSVTSFEDLNDSAWICGRIARGADRVGVPAVLLRLP